MTTDQQALRLQFEAAGTRLHGWGPHEYKLNEGSDNYTYRAQNEGFALWCDALANTTKRAEPLPPVETSLPQWIDDLKGKAPMVDRLVEYIITLTAALSQLATKNDATDLADVLRTESSMANALKPFALLAGLYDDERRIKHMPNSGDILSWNRIEGEYSITVEHLRAARSALAGQLPKATSTGTAQVSAASLPEAVTQETLAWLVDPGAGSARDKLTRSKPSAEIVADVTPRGGSITELVARAAPPSGAKRSRLDLSDDKTLLDSLSNASWSLECFNMPTGGDDNDIGWRVVEQHMAEPHRRTVAEVFEDNPREAIRAAILRKDS